ncbi:short-chain dehydrogenase/reductase [Kutzneria sp. 744]|nr:short-chain dehydrogenase/reductase [Kutzneria sp. 744]
MTPQRPLGSGFGCASTADDVIKGIDLTGRTAIVTGGYSGIGTETARALRAAGAEVIVPTRNHAKAAEALAGIDGIQIATVDLLDPASVDAFAQAFLASGRPLHILVNSAGIMANPLTRDARGYESQFATNHLGHFQLATALWPALRRAGGAREVSVSSWVFFVSPTSTFDDPNFERREYQPFLGLRPVQDRQHPVRRARRRPRPRGRHPGVLAAPRRHQEHRTGQACLRRHAAGRRHHRRQRRGRHPPRARHEDL